MMLLVEVEEIEMGRVVAAAAAAEIRLEIS